MADLSGYMAMTQTDAEAAYQKALANVATQKAMTRQQYGFNADGTLDQGNSYGLYQQTQKKYDNQLQQEAQQYGITVGADGKTWSVDNNSNGQLAQLIQAKQKAEYQSGLKGVYGTDGIPSDLQLDTANQYGDYQQMLDSGAGSLMAAEDSGRQRGLGGKGLGAQGASQARFQINGGLQDYRQNLLDSLTQNIKSQQNTGKTINTDLGNITYGRNQDTFALTQQLNSLLGGYDQQGYQALLDKQATLRDASLQEALNNIASNNFDTAPPDNTNGNPPSTPGGPPAITGANAIRNTTANGSAYNPAAYVPGYASQALANAIQKKGTVANAYNTNANKRG